MKLNYHNKLTKLPLIYRYSNENENENENENIVKYLLENGEDINKENIKGLTPLFNSSKSRNKIIVNYLV
ncbi:hypothetical protein BCR32DRAFT_276502 [Anaeromyces robustus]|uniref:Uncharacterized protein n=1 Tax=Anaeromyces robustus TaxID=1754192 RepID=A0A1Y1XHH8_9FUNG|nr:hypothetical protein BCR32DRAFT_276502 [Anaeromyces robustus]|eukprot:ORX85203.1 hypothetical protein BCR32DRAFT_276502 [Anaeromyces robustus]